MPDQSQKAKLFKALHVAGRPLVLLNIWDAGSAQAVASAGSAALATGSWSVAAAHGLPDGERLTLELAVANLKRIVAVTELPVTIDIESGYGNPGATVAHVIDAGAIGCNLEDSDPQDGSLHELSEQVTHIRAARRVADASGTEFFINARTDVFLQRKTDGTDTSLLSAAIERARAYVDAGADGIFVPGLQSADLVGQLAASISVPINIMVGAASASWKDYAEAGVARIKPWSLALPGSNESFGRRGTTRGERTILKLIGVRSPADRDQCFGSSRTARASRGHQPACRHKGRPRHPELRAHCFPFRWLGGRT